ncbi:MAG: 1-acyl-sn-glycerol-3-phosphate acyltransferase [Actinobacteria bacterium]|nr:1-acyl-sn-glycerol-3-phosphate acyltransferase [Actinomycetota bacterium]
MPPPSPAELFLDGPPGAEVAYLLDAATNREQRMLENWLARERPGAQTLRIASSRRRVSGEDDRLLEWLEQGDDPYLIPTRVVWMAPERKGRRSVGWPDALKPGDPRDPKGLLAWWTGMFHRDRIRLIAAAGAYASELKGDYRASEEVDGVAAYITRRAWRVLDQAERRLRGNRYKIPRFVPEAILSRRDFVDAVHRHANETGTSREEALETAEGHLREIAATHSPYVIDLVANAIHALYRQGYREIMYDPQRVREIAELGSRHPIVFLPSHRSNLDRLALQFMLWENDLPPNHTAGGVNVDFFPVGPLVRRTGVFFIRRSFRDDELYKLVLRAYIDYLVEKRFPLEWYMEGGRSRTGKLLPPRLGLLSYVVGSLRRGKAEEIKLIPVSITYDHIQDLPGYAREAQGRGKERESIPWLLKAVRSLRRRYGNIHIAFGEPVSVAATLDTVGAGDEGSMGLQKLGFEVMHRIARVTPVTPTALLAIVILASEREARTAEELAQGCRRLLDYIVERGVPITAEADLSEPDLVAAHLHRLAEHDNVSGREEAGHRVFWLDDEQRLRLSYYRNMVAHFFVVRGLAEMALRARREARGDEPDAVIEKTLELRDLLKFEFFFPERAEFIEEVDAEISLEAPGWRERLEEEDASEVLANIRPAMAHWVVLPILDAYAVVADELVAWKGEFEEKRFLKRCLARARVYRIEEEIHGESVSRPLFVSALALARNRGMIDGSPEVEARREAFAAEVARARELAAD